MVTIDKILEVVASAGVVENMDKFDPIKSFQDNGVDSLDVFTILLAIEEKLGVKFSEDELDNANSVTKLKDLINSR